MNGRSSHLPSTIEEFSGNTTLEDFRGAQTVDVPEVNPNMPEQQHLKPVDTMTEDEIRAELARYRELGIITNDESSDTKSAPTEKSDNPFEAESIPTETKISDNDSKESDGSPTAQTSMSEDDLAQIDYLLRLKAKESGGGSKKSELSELKLLRKELVSARAKYNQVDAGSDVVDFHIGSFNQEGLGSCAMLAQLNGISDEQMRRIIQKKTDENGKTYYEVTFPIDSGSGTSVRVTEEELKARSIELSDGTITKTIDSFSRGDADVTLMEMAYIRRFGIDPVVNGGDLKFVNDVFTYPEEQNQHVGTSYEVTEEKIQQALQNGEHASMGLHHTSRLPEDFSYLKEFQSSSGVTARWKIGGVDNRTSVLSRLDAMFKKHGNPHTDMSQYEQMSDDELMDATYRYVSNDFWFSGVLELSNGVSIIEDHAYTLKGYDTQTKEVIIANPHQSNEDIRIPMDIAQRFFDISV